MPIVAKVVKWSISDSWRHLDDRPPFPDGDECYRKVRNRKTKVSTWLFDTFNAAHAWASKIDGKVIPLHYETGLPCE